nr:L-histidine N(alpha)-methyltransferase [Nitratireductor sp. XY-223]
MLGLRLADDAGSKQTAGPRGTPAGSKAKTRDPQGGFAASILAGLKGGQKTIEAKWLYDAAGSALFDRITALEEYYPTRIETGILAGAAHRLREFAQHGAALVELGSGSSVKTRLLLDALPDLAAYLPVDISAAHLGAAATKLEADYAALDIHPVVADFTRDFALPADYTAMPKLLFFPGSTIGNFEVAESLELMRRLRGLDNLSAFVVGFDLVKDRKTLLRAYDDKGGVTARFNLNLLTRINRELGADFDPGAFYHQACWNETESRIEMHLVSRRDQEVTVAGERVGFGEGETIHTENSHKYTRESFEALAVEAGWSVSDVWTDEKDHFAVAVLT